MDCKSLHYYKYKQRECTLTTQFCKFISYRRRKRCEIDYIKCSEIDYVTKCILFVTK